MQQGVQRDFRHIRGAGGIVSCVVGEIDVVLRERQDVQAAGLVVDHLTAAIKQDHPWAIGAFDQTSPLGEDGRMRGFVTRIIDQDPAQRAVRIA